MSHTSSPVHLHHIEKTRKVKVEEHINKIFRTKRRTKNIFFMTKVDYYNSPYKSKNCKLYYVNRNYGGRRINKK